MTAWASKFTTVTLVTLVSVVRMVTLLTYVTKATFVTTVASVTVTRTHNTFSALRPFPMLLFLEPFRFLTLSVVQCLKNAKKKNAKFNLLKSGSHSAFIKYYIPKCDSYRSVCTFSYLRNMQVTLRCHRRC